MTRGDFIRSIKTIWPEYVFWRDNNKTKQLGVKKGSFIIKIKAKIDDSWIQKPPLEIGETKGPGVWDISKLPINSNHLIPSVPGKDLERKALPLPCPIEFEDPDLEKLFSLTGGKGPEFKLIQDGKVSLSPHIFDSTHCPIDKNFLFGTVDSICRDSLRESIVAEQFTDLLIEKISNNLAEWGTFSTDLSAMQTFFMDTLSTLSLITTSMCRSRLLLSGLYATNKLSCRQIVLDQCVGPPQTKDLMKASSFVSPTLFGPVPESLKRRLDNSTYGDLNAFKLRINKNMGNFSRNNIVNNGTSTFKRQQSFNPSQSFKRPRRTQPSFPFSTPFRPTPHQGFHSGRGGRDQKPQRFNFRGRGRSGSR